MVDPATMVISNSLGLAGKSSGTEATIATGAQTLQIGKNIAANIPEANKTEAAERTGFYREKLRAPSRRNQNFPQTKSKDGSEAVDADSGFTSAKSSKPQQVFRRPPEQPDKAWSRIGATSERLSQIDPDFSRNGSQLYAIA